MRPECAGQWGNRELTTSQPGSLLCARCLQQQGHDCWEALLPSHFSMFLHHPTHISETRQRLSKSHAAWAARTPLSSPAPCRLSSLNVLSSPTARTLPSPDAPKAMPWWVSPEVRPRSEPTPWEGSDQDDRDRARIACPGLHEDPPL